MARMSGERTTSLDSARSSGPGIACRSRLDKRLSYRLLLASATIRSEVPSDINAREITVLNGRDMPMLNCLGLASLAATYCRPKLLHSSTRQRRLCSNHRIELTLNGFHAATIVLDRFLHNNPAGAGSIRFNPVKEAGKFSVQELQSVGFSLQERQQSSPFKLTLPADEFCDAIQGRV